MILPANNTLLAISGFALHKITPIFFFLFSYFVDAIQFPEDVFWDIKSAHGLGMFKEYGNAIQYANASELYFERKTKRQVLHWDLCEFIASRIQL